MLEKLEKVETRYEEVQLRLCDPEIVTDQAQYKKLMQEAKRLARSLKNTASSRRRAIHFRRRKLCSTRAGSIKSSTIWCLKSWSRHALKWSARRRS